MADKQAPRRGRPNKECRARARTRHCPQCPQWGENHPDAAILAIVEQGPRSSTAQAAAKPNDAACGALLLALPIWLTGLAFGASVPLRGRLRAICAAVTTAKCVKLADAVADFDWGCCWPLMARSNLSALNSDVVLVDAGQDCINVVGLLIKPAPRPSIAAAQICDVGERHDIDIDRSGRIVTLGSEPRAGADHKSAIPLLRRGTLQASGGGEP